MKIPMNSGLCEHYTERLNNGFKLVYDGNNSERSYRVFIEAPNAAVCILYAGRSFDKAQEKYIEISTIDDWCKKQTAQFPEVS